MWKVIDIGDVMMFLCSLKYDLLFDVEKMLEVVMVIMGVDGEWSEEEIEFLLLFIYKLFVKVLVLGKDIL